MADRTKIEWTDATWNPFRGCSRKSAGCLNCYAEPSAARFSAEGLPFHGFVKLVDGKPRWTGRVEMAGDLEQPLRWRKPRRIFVNSMSDTFHENVADEWLDQIFAVMALTPQHTYQILTKRPDRALKYFGGGPGPGWGATNARVTKIARAIVPNLPEHWCALSGGSHDHIMMGTSAEDQSSWEERREPLLKLAGSFKLFLSAEPLLGPLDLQFNWDHCDLCGGRGTLARWPKGRCHVCHGRGRLLINGLPNRSGYRRLSWVIAGGESGPRARPMHPDWVRSLRDQCAFANVPFFFKQWGEFDLSYDRDENDPDWLRCGEMNRHPGRWINLNGDHGFHGKRVHYARKVGKRRAGRLLDGITHDAFPEVQHG